MILITGGGGFFGLHAASALAEKGQEVLLLQRRDVSPPAFLLPFWGKQVKQATGSVLSLPFLFGLAKTFPLESIIHAAFDSNDIDVRGGGIKASSHRTMYDVIQSGVDATANILEVAHFFNLSRVTFVSSVDVYRGSPAECPEWREDAFLPPVSFSPIGTTKKAGEQLSFLYARACGLSVICLRVGRLYGPHATHAEPIRIMVERAAAGKPAVLSHVPSDSRGHTIYAKDAGEATALLHLVKSPKHYIYNVADGANPTMEEAASLVKDVIPNATITLGQPEQTKPSHSGISIERLKEEAGFTPRDLKQGIIAYIEWLRHGVY
jgi:UDP-glucose 4-epimerase